MNIYIVYETNLWSHPQDFTLGYSLFEAVKLIINADFSKWKYSVYDIGFYAKGSFSLSDGGISGNNILTFDADLS